jgi:hypothetical protein
MKYMLLMNIPKAATHPAVECSKEDFQAHCAFFAHLQRELKESGEMVSTEGLALPDQAKLVRADNGGIPVTDGVFPESKEFLASFSIIEVESPERAYAIAARVSAAPGPGGAPINMWIEVRQVMSGPPPEYTE